MRRIRGKTGFAASCVQLDWSEAQREAAEAASSYAGGDEGEADSQRRDLAHGPLSHYDEEFGEFFDFGFSLDE